jgi:hypothetical protein
VTDRLLPRDPWELSIDDWIVVPDDRRLLWNPELLEYADFVGLSLGAKGALLVIWLWYERDGPVQVRQLEEHRCGRVTLTQLLNAGFIEIVDVPSDA